MLCPDKFVVMPNHVHGIIWIVGATPRVAPTTLFPRGPDAGTIGAIICQFKSITAKCMNALWIASGAPVWQRNYYEHIIHTDDALGRIRDFIQSNPQHWADDQKRSVLECVNQCSIYLCLLMS